MLQFVLRQNQDNNKMPARHMNHNVMEGFTLVEMAIVLVVIGLVVGGILVGRDLIHAAELRATISQVEKYNAAVNTFRLKFNGLPGDMANTADYGFDAGSNGNGDGIIGLCSTNPACNYIGGNPTNIGPETINFWYHLSRAGLIPDAITSQPAGGGVGFAGISSPKVKLPAVSSFNGVNYGWAIAADVSFDVFFGGGSFPAHSFVLVNNITAVGYNNAGVYAPIDINAIDTKLDDGFPETGRVRAYFFASFDGVTGVMALGRWTVGTPGVGPGGPNAPVCVRDDTSPPQYNVQYSGSAIGGTCGAVIKASF